MADSPSLPTPTTPSPSTAPTYIIPFSELMGTEMVDLYVGKEGKRYRVHKTLLCKKIPFFERRFQGCRNEDKQLSAQFPEHTPKAFDVLLHWVYHDALPTLNYNNLSSVRGLAHLNWSPISVYKLAERLDLSAVCDEVLDCYITVDLASNRIPQASTLEKIYAITLSGSMMRKYAAHVWYYILHNVRAEHATNYWPTSELMSQMKKHEDLGTDLFTLMREQETGPQAVSDPRKLTRCHFHRHGKDESCYLDKTTPKSM